VNSEPLLECVPNFSEGRRLEVLSALAHAAGTIRGARLLAYESDPDHNRAVFTLAGSPHPLIQAIRAMAGTALRLIDLNYHEGVHPRIGALDVVPFVPLGDSPISVAVQAAEEAGALLAKDLGLPCYLYGQAARSPNRRNLAAVRNRGFEALRADISTDPTLTPDFGPLRLHPTAGAVAVGARDILIAFNVLLDTQDLRPARAIARRIRERDGGMPAVRALGLPLARLGCVQVSMNLINYRKTGLFAAFRRVRELAQSMGVPLRGSELIGMLPEDALDGGEIAELGLLDFDPDARILERRL